HIRRGGPPHGRDSLSAVVKPVPVDPRFGFGENWRRFVEDVDSRRVAFAEDSLREMLGLPHLGGMTFLDIGCGSGLFSLAAVRLGAAQVYSLDYDRESVAATHTLKERHAADADWAIERGDATDSEKMASLGQYDIVYCWGVLHHTGAMWRALDNACRSVAPGGLLFTAIYNDQG